MPDDVLVDGLVKAKALINLLRFRETQFIFPLADAKLVRVSNYLGSQISEVERSMWDQAQLEA